MRYVARRVYASISEETPDMVEFTFELITPACDLVVSVNKINAGEACRALDEEWTSTRPQSGKA